MKFDAANDLYTLASGRTFYANCGLVSISDDATADGAVSHGYDGGIDISDEYGDDGPWTAEERAELADEMIQRWTAFKAGSKRAEDPADESTRMSADGK